MSMIYILGDKWEGHARLEHKHEEDPRGITNSSIYYGSYKQTGKASWGQIL